MKRGALRRFGRDVVVGLIGFGVVFSLVYATGKAFEPPEPQAALAQPNVAYGIDLAEEAGSDPTLLEDLGAELAALEEPSAAIVEISGAIEERLVLQSTDLGRFGSETLFDSETGEPNPDAEGPVDLSIKYSTGTASLSLVVREGAVGVPQTDRMDVILSVGPKSWYTHDGDCTLELVGFDWEVHTFSGHEIVGGGIPQTYEQVFPAFAGVVSCKDVTELRSGEMASFSAVFSFLPAFEG